MRIAMISEHASPLACIGGVDSGGQNVYVAQVARCLAEAGHEVDVFTRQDAAGLARVVDVGPRYRVIHVSAGPAAFVAKERLLEHMPEFARFCEHWMQTAAPYDVIHANFFMSGWVGLRLKEALGLPLVTTFHALGLVRREHQGDADTFPAERIDIERALASLSDRLVAECPQDRTDLQRLYGADPHRMALVPCGFDGDEFAPVERSRARRELGIPPDEFMVLQLGRMVPRKGVETVVRAMAEPACAGMRLRVVGGDCDVADPVRTPEIGRLRDIAHECGAGDRVRFEGRKTRAELRLWYAACDVFVTTPWYEPFGITPLEAMACARPVVGSAVGGVQFSVVDGETGLLVPPKDPQALARALATLAAQPERARRMGEAGLARVRARFTWQGVADSLARVFADAAACPVGPRFHVMACHDPMPTARSWEIARPAIFLDKDGTLVHDVPYNVDPARVRFTPGAMEAIRRWRAAGYRIVVVTNQPGIGRGLFDVAALQRLHLALAARLAQAEAPIDAFIACPHNAAEHCACRKPRPAMILEAARALRIDLEGSWMVGDILNDVEAGHRAGCRAVLIDNGNETEWLAGPMRAPDLRCADLLEAAELTLRPRAEPASAAEVAVLGAAA